MAEESAKVAPTAWLLLAARFARSVWQGALVVDFALYLDALGWSAVEISGVLSAALLLGAVLSLVVGPLSDRFGRRRFLLVYDAVQGLAALTLSLTAAPLPLVGAAVIGGFGRGGNGAAGPFSPVEQAWLAQCVPATERAPFYSLNAALGFAGMAAGAVLAGFPAWHAGVAPPAAAYRPLFAVTVGLSIVSFAFLAAGKDAEGGTQPRSREAATAEEESERRRENGLLLRLVLANLLNGAGVGLVGPLLAYWFALRFHHGPGTIGPMLAVGFLFASAASFLARWPARRFGPVRTIVVMRALGLVLLIALPFAPNFWLAGLLYIGRSVLNRGTTGARAAVNMGIVRAERRGFSAASANVAMQVPRAMGPVIAGLFYDAGLFAEPFLVAALFQAAYIWFYERSFGGVRLR